METAFLDHLAQELSFLKSKKLLLAVSGGLDSAVMTHLFHQHKFDISIAHCNFQLRANESFDDEKFVRDFAERHSIPIFVTHFDTLAFAEDYKLSTQVAARQLRYNWFYELAEEHAFDYILTAHHADDNLETFLINLSRGTGIDGLCGIPFRNEIIVRPLLPFSRNEIEEYAKEKSIQWREDSSNASDKYLRNKIRHNLVPILKELNPQFLESFRKTQEYLQQTERMADDAAIMIYQQVAQHANEEIHFNLAKLKKLPNYKDYLYHWLREFGFTAWDDIFALTESDSGKQILAPKYKLIKNREYLLLCPLPQSDHGTKFLIDPNQKDVKVPINLTFSNAQSISNASNTTIFVDADKLHYPLLLRRWQEGDSFEPLGMNGKSKKISKLFKDEKLSLTDKQRVWLLCSENKIVWVIGIRADERFKVEPTTSNILQIALLK